MIILELQKYWKKFRAFSDIFVSALRLTCTGSYRIVQRCFSERTSRLRGYFKNVQLRLYFCLVWSSGDVPRVYGSSGRENLDFGPWDACGWDPLPHFLFKTALGCSLSPFGCPLSLSTSLSPSLLVFLFFTLLEPPQHRHRSTNGCPRPITPVEET